MLHALSNHIYGIFETVFPPRCIICTQPCRVHPICQYCLPKPIHFKQPRCKCCFQVLDTENNTICPFCDFYRPDTRATRYLWVYDATTRDFIRTMKYLPSTALLTRAAKIVAAHWYELSFKDLPYCLVPMPSSIQRLRHRGMHHMLYFSRLLRSACPPLLSAPIYDGLTIHKTTKAQTDLQSKGQRIRNMRHAFYLKNPNAIAHKHILLLDDVITTGASIAAATAVLRAHQARSVSVLALAVSPGVNSYRDSIQRAFS